MLQNKNKVNFRHTTRHIVFCALLCLLFSTSASDARRSRVEATTAATKSDIANTSNDKAATLVKTSAVEAASATSASAETLAAGAAAPNIKDNAAKEVIVEPAEKKLTAQTATKTDADNAVAVATAAVAALTKQWQQDITAKNSANSSDIETVGLPDLDSKLDELSFCNPDLIGFEIVTGYVLSAPDKLMDSLPGTLMLTDCLDACQSNATCHAVNYETGLCVLFAATADELPGALTKSQFPVFTIYAQKTCLGMRTCSRAWFADRVLNHKLNGEVKRTFQATSRLDCTERCLAESEFMCRSANYDRATNTCELLDMDRVTLAGRSGAFQAYEGIDYLENNCAEEPNKLCEFKRLSGRILKTVDSVFQDVGSSNECRELCLNSPYRCHSYDYGDTGESVCRLSHHSRATLSEVQEPYLTIPEATTYELSFCYNVTVDCGAGDMVTRIRTSKIFDGKVYAKGSPKSCAVDVKNSLEFELRMRYQDLECNVRQSASTGRYTNDVVIQHHDMIVTSSDLGLAVACQYDLTNKSITTDFDLLSVRGDILPALTEEVIVDSPNVIMKITSRDGAEVMRSAQVGDPLALKFEILDAQSPYEIFVRELVAMDGGDNAEITLIDSNGCPTDEFIMGPILKSTISGKVLLSHFDAFKFPSSEVVQFRALVTPCMPSCEPVQCEQDDAIGDVKSLLSFGRRRRRSADVTTRTRRDAATTLVKKPSHEDMLLVQKIKISDKFNFDKHQSPKSADFDSNEMVYISNETQGLCVNGIGLLSAAIIFIIAQLAVIFVWTYLYQRRRKQRFYENENLSNIAASSHCHSSSARSTVVSSAPSVPSEAMNQLYENGIASRYGSQF